MARTKQTARKQPLRQFGGKQPRTIPAPQNPAASPPPPPQKLLHERLAIIEQKTEPHYKAVACIDNKNIRVPEKELCKSVEATIDRVIQSCWTDHFISDSDVYFTVVILCIWRVNVRTDNNRFKFAAFRILELTNHHSFTGIEDFYLDNRDNTEFSSCLPEKYQKDLLRRRNDPTRMGRDFADFAKQRKQEISTWVNTKLLEKLKNKTLNLPPDLQSIASPDIEKWTYKKCNPDRSNTSDVLNFKDDVYFICNDNCPDKCRCDYNELLYGLNDWLPRSEYSHVLKLPGCPEPNHTAR